MTATSNPIFSATEEGDRAVGFTGKIQLTEQQRDSRSSFFWDYQHSAGSVCPSGLTKPGAGPKSCLSTLSGLRTGTGKSNFLGMTDFPAFGLQQGGCRHSLDWMLPSGRGMGSRAYRKQKNHRRNSDFPESHK